jgi:predicted transcriptional regulator
MLVFSLVSTLFLRSQPFTFEDIPFSFSNPVSSSIFFKGNIEANIPAFNQTTRNMIFSVIESNPGIHFRGICNILGISVGVAQYHLGILTKSGLIRSFKDGRFKRFFNSQEFGLWELKLISLLRKKTTGIILTSMLRKKSVSHKFLMQESGISSQALSWHIKRLKSLGILSVNCDGVRNVYSLKPEKIEIINKCFQQLL